MTLVVQEKRKTLTLPVQTHEPDVVARVERRRQYNTVTEIRAGSVAAHAGFSVGDKVLSVNGRPITDIVDWKFHLAGEKAAIEFLRDGETHLVNVAKGYDDDLGLTFCRRFVRWSAHLQK